MARRWLLWLLVIAFVWAVITRFTQLEHLVETLRRGEWPWVLAAAVLQALFYSTAAVLYYLCFQTVGVAANMTEMLTVLLASLFVNTVAPSGGLAGSALFVDDAARRGQSAARAAAGALLARIADTAGFTVLLLAGMVYLFLRGDLKAYQVTGAILLLLITAGLGALLVLGVSRPDALRRTLDGMARGTNRLARRLRRPAPLAPDWAETHAAEFSQAGVAIASRPGMLARTLAVALAVHVVDLASLFTLFLAFHQPAGFGVLVAGYVMGILFWKMSLVPEGVGVVEGVMILVYTSVGVPAVKATVISLAFRGLTYWLPMVMGFLLLRRLRLFSGGRPYGKPGDIRAG